jgi:hypothetical protein
MQRLHVHAAVDDHRLSLFTALPIAGFEKSSLTARVREIGRTAGAARPTLG